VKAILENIKLNKGNSSFYAYRFQTSVFEFKWHYHPEYELTYILKGKGHRIVGNTYEYFSDGDLVLLGGNLPHTWSGKLKADLSSEAIVVQFSKEILASFLELDECRAIKKMLEISSRGLSFSAHENLISKLISITENQGVERIMKLISILNDLSEMEYRIIASDTFHHVVSKKSELRINKVCLFIQNNFYTKITLKQVAELVYMTESNFCKFFKKATGKTYSDYLNEIRINEVCRLLTQTENSVSQISFECGFESLSYFNRVFFNKKGITPSAYRKAASF